MTSNPRIGRTKAIKAFIAGLSIAVIVAGCGSMGTQEGEVYEPEPGVVDGPADILGSSAYPASDDRLQEITVTAAKIKRFPKFGWRRAEAKPIERLAALSHDEELWIITKDDVRTPPGNDEVGTGSMVGRVPGENVLLPLPLQHTAVEAQIETYLSTVDVRQEFTNPFDRKIEAVYLFPLPEKAAVSEFVMQIGERKIRGILRDKEQARRIYEEARSQGYRASLLVQRRPNVFEQKVANIEPGESIDIEIRYFHTLSYRDGWYSFVFPTVVGPRYNPIGTPDPIEATHRLDTRQSQDGVAVRYLAPDERSAHDISITVNIDAGVSIEELKASHKVNTSRTGEDRATVTLAADDTMPNRDFILDFRVAGDEMKTRLITHRDAGAEEGHFTLMLFPPKSERRLDRQGVEMVFVVDTSGSMDGRPLEQAKYAIHAALDRLQRNDTIQIIRFSANASQLAERPLRATRHNIERAQRYVRTLRANGGTEMVHGIKAALDFPHDPERMRFVTFMTDGYIGNEGQILAEIDRRIGHSRIFSFGVGDSVNRFLMERMAKIGRGAVAYLTSQDDARALMDQYFSRISQPAMTDIEINWGSLAATDIYPARIPDLYVGRPVVISGRFLGPESDVVVYGRHSGRLSSTLVSHQAASDTHPQLPKLWARLRIADLNDQLMTTGDPDESLAAAIRETALTHQLVSQYTSFVAVDASERTDGDFGVTVNQPVPVPDGVRYETTVDGSE